MTASPINDKNVKTPPMNFPIATLLAALSLLTTAAFSIAASPPHHTSAPLPDHIGRAGMVAATLPCRTGEEIVLAAGGANFPYAKPGAKTPAERGEKVFHADVFLLRDGRWTTIGRLPRPIGYAAFTDMPQGMVIAGGCNANGHLKECMLVTPGPDKQISIRELPPLPHPVAYPAFAREGTTLYVIGGQLAPDSTEALVSAYFLNLASSPLQWEKLPDMPGPGRILATGAIHDGKLLIMGGCSLAPDAKGQAERTYLSSVRVLDTATRQWSTTPVADIPGPLAAAANPAPRSAQGTVLLIGGDPGNYYRASLKNAAPLIHPGQSRAIYSFDPAKNTWTHVGEWPVGIATAPAVIYRGDILTISGETYPGIRTAITGAASSSL